MLDFFYSAELCFYLFTQFQSGYSHIHTFKSVICIPITNRANYLYKVVFGRVNGDGKDLVTLTGAHSASHVTVV